MARLASILILLASTLLLFSLQVRAEPFANVPENNDVDNQLSDKVAQQMFAVGYVIVNDDTLAQKLSKGLLRDELVASVNILPGVSTLVPAKPSAEGVGSMVVFITRVVNVPLVKVMIEAEMVAADDEAPFYQIFFSVLADINGEYLQFIDHNTVDAGTLNAKNSSTAMGNDTEEGERTSTPSDEATDGAAVTVVPAISGTVVPAATINEPSQTIDGTVIPVGPRTFPATNGPSTSLRKRRPTSTTKPSEVQIVDLSEFDGSGLVVTVKRNTPLTIQTKVNSGTGYMWHVDFEHTTFKDVEGPLTISHDDAMPGAPRLEQFSLTAAVSGVVVLQLVAPNQEAVKAIEITIKVA